MLTCCHALKTATICLCQIVLKTITAPEHDVISESGWRGGVVVRMSDLRLTVVGSNPGFSEVGNRFFRVNYLGM